MRQKKTPRPTPARKPRPRTAAQEELFGNGDPSRQNMRELGRELAQIRRDYMDIEYSFVRVVRGY